MSFQYSPLQKHICISQSMGTINSDPLLLNKLVPVAHITPPQMDNLQEITSFWGCSNGS